MTDTNKQFYYWTDALTKITFCVGRGVGALVGLK